MSVKRKRLSLKDKIDIITESEITGLSARRLAEKYHIGKTQTARIIKKKNELKKLYEEGGNEKLKRKHPKTEGLDQVVFNWFCDVQTKNLAISGPLIKQKALEEAQNLQLVDFKASNGWLEKFCKRHNIDLKATCSGSADASKTGFAENACEGHFLAEHFMQNNQGELLLENAVPIKFIQSNEKKKKRKGTDDSNKPSTSLADLSNKLRDINDLESSNINFSKGLSFESNIEPKSAQSRGSYSLAYTNIEAQQSANTIISNVDNSELLNNRIKLEPTELVTVKTELVDKEYDNYCIEKEQTCSNSINLCDEKNRNNDQNPIEIFFRSMAATVMTFPPHLAAEAKAKVFQVISDLEIKYIAEQNEGRNLTY